MGSFKGHVLPGSLFLAVGLWHVWSAVARFVSEPATAFRVRVWNPVGKGRLRHLELYVVAAGTFADMCVELLYSTHLHFLVGPDHILNPSHMNVFEHGGMLFMFFLFGVAALLSEKTKHVPLTNEALCLIAATAFTSEFVLFYFHSRTHMGLEGYYHFLLVIIVGFCIVSTVAGIFFPSSFLADLASGVAITLQGLWYYQTAFTLYGSMIPTGCILEGIDVVCKPHDAQVRGELIGNFQLFSLVFLTFVFVLGSYAVAVAKYGHSDLRRWSAGDLIESSEDVVEELPVH